MQPEIEFQFTTEQQDRFNAYYAKMQEEYHLIFGIDIIASVRRLGLITLRLAMILSALRLGDTGEEVSTLICDDEDFDSAIAISRVLIKHTVRVFRELSADDLTKPAAERTSRQQQFLSALPNSFSTKSYLKYADRLGIPHPSAERYIKNWCRLGLLNRIKHGYYEKTQS